MRTTSLKLPALSNLPGASGLESEADRSMLSTSLTLAAMSLGYGVVQLDVTVVNTARVRR